MRLIKKIEVKYLRSLYELNLANSGDLNVVFGRNDSGKSNLLRALNLFFNGKSEPYQVFDFALDLSDPRKAEARSAKGQQFFWIKITFIPPPNYRNALGQEITIKKQWNREGNVTETIMGNQKFSQSRLTRLMNEIDFTYIPAVKDLNVYADLIERMYGAAAETPELAAATAGFIDAISGQASALTTQLTRIFGSESKLAPPTDMKRLFRNLDFSLGPEGHSLFRQKGDGVKARHLPELLRFINQNETGKKFYLWGFEEPENSLDLGAAKEESARFAEFAGRDDTQVFVTSHSPAFYLCETETDASIRRYFITKQVKDENRDMMPKNAAKPIDDINAAEEEMQQAGLMQLPFVIRKLTEHQDKLDESQALQRRYASQVEKLTKSINDLNIPTLFVEGKHDVALFSNAIVRLGKKSDILVKELGGTPEKGAFFKSVLENGGINPNANTLFLFDNDPAGRSAYKGLCKSDPQDTPQKYIKNVFAWALPFSDEFEAFISEYEGSRQKAFFTAEFLYPASAAAAICSKLIQPLTSPEISDWKNCIHDGYHKSLKQTVSRKLGGAREGTADWLFARGVPGDLKKHFSYECIRQSICTSNIDAVAKTITDVLLGVETVPSGPD